MSQQPVAPAGTPPAPDSSSSPPRVPVASRYVVLGCAAVTTAALAAVGVLLTVRTEQLARWWEHGGPGGEGTLALAGALGMVAGLGIIAAFVATSVWLLGLRRVAEWASPGTYHRRAAHWAVLGWVVPVVNLWFPLQVVADASRGVGSRVRNLLPWWLAWLALGVALSADSVDGGELTSASDLMTWIRVQQVAAVLAVIACVLWWRVVRSATAAARRSVAGDTVGP